MGSLVNNYFILVLLGNWELGIWELGIWEFGNRENCSNVLEFRRLLILLCGSWAPYGSGCWQYTRQR